MTEYKLRGTSDQYGERGHCWIEKDGKCIDIEDLLTDVEELQVEVERLRRAIRHTAEYALDLMSPEQIHKYLLSFLVEENPTND